MAAATVWFNFLVEPVPNISPYDIVPAPSVTRACPANPSAVGNSAPPIVIAPVNVLAPAIV